MNPWSVVLGAILTGAISYFAVPLLVAHVENTIHKQLSDRTDYVEPRLAGADILGHLECTLYFGALLWAPGGVGLIAAWLGFKTAAKWKTWASVEKVGLTETQIRYRGYVIGTAANLVAALAGVAVAHLP